MENTNRKNLYLLAFTLVVVMLGFGMVIPILPFYIRQFNAGGSAFGMLVAIAALTEFLFGPLWGSLSDRTGRKPILVIGMFGYGLSMLLFGLSTQLWMLFASRALSGVLSSAMLSTAMAYIGDSTSSRERGGGMGLLGAAAGVGTIVGPGIGGLLAKRSLATPFFFAAGLSLLSLLLIILLLPESRPRAARLQSAAKMKIIDFHELGQAITSPIGIFLLLAFLVTLGTSNFEVDLQPVPGKKDGLLPRTDRCHPDRCGGGGACRSRLPDRVFYPPLGRSQGDHGFPACCRPRIYPVTACQFLPYRDAHHGFFCLCHHLPAPFHSLAHLTADHGWAGSRSWAEQLLCQPGAHCRFALRRGYV